MHHALYAFLAALTVTYITTPLVKTLALRWGIMDSPGDRKIHTRPIPYLGGLAIYAGFLLSAVVFLGVGDRQITGILLGATLLMLLGTVDDMHSLSAKWKFVGQLLIITWVVGYFDVRIWWITYPFTGMVYLGSLSLPLSVLWIIAVVNTVNLIDGLDGLAAGVSSIAAISLFLIAWQQGQYPVAVLSAALIGSSLGFLRYNFNPARIFMGDSGSMLLGFVLAAISVEGALKSVATIALLVPILALGLPIFDTLFAVIRRYTNGRPIYEPDRSHLHHQLLDKGLSQRQVVLVLYAISAALGLCAVLITSVDGYWPVLLILIFISLLSYMGAKKMDLFSMKQEE